ncbi:MAG: hypothetical protein II648_05740, partial [Bacteroidales bacterium]|nr:hypothetical protein [Bacteroidales bacterium]
YLSRNADFIVMNHPDRTLHTTPRSMRLLSGYRFMEADSGNSTDLLHWDEALSAGHYSHCLINDDCHDSGNHRKIARRCNWLQAPSAQYKDFKPALLKGCFYSMRIPDFGDGDWDVKYSENASLPGISNIGLKGDTTFIHLSAPARIEAWGQDHSLLAQKEGSELEYVMQPSDSYVHFTAYFDNGVVIYTNAFARFDSSKAASPYKDAPHSVNYLLTVLFNLCLIAIIWLCLIATGRLFSHKKLKA